METTQNNAQTSTKLHPAVWAAAISATAFSLVGIGAVTGIIPSPLMKSDAPAAAVATAPAAATAPATVPPITINQQVTVPQDKVAAKEPVKTATAPTHTTKVSYSSKPTVAHDNGIDVYSSKPQNGSTVRTSNNEYQVAGSTAPIAATCKNCGTIEAITPVAQQGESTGAGGVIGGLLGGVVGNQVGRGNGRTLATIAGIAGGALAGNHIEKSQNTKTTYDIIVRFDDGTSRTLHQDTQPSWRVGDKVKVENSLISLR